MCGLKYLNATSFANRLLSHPLRMCGLKCGNQMRKDLEYLVTSLTDVWIEINETMRGEYEELSHIPYGCVD